MLRPRLLTLLSLVTFVLGLLATLFVFAEDRIFDADSFSTTAASTLTDPDVNAYLADEISAALISEAPDLAVAGPLLADLIGAGLESSTSTSVVRAAAAEAHRGVFTEDQSVFLLELSDLLVTIEASLAAIDPELADAIPDDLTTLAVDFSSGELTTDTVRLAETVRILTFVFLILFVICLIVIVEAESNRFRGFARMGLVLGAVGLTLVVTRAVGAEVLASYGEAGLQRDALRAAWNLVLGDLGTWGWALIGIGAFLAGLGWAVLTADAALDQIPRLVDRLRQPPATTFGVLGRGVLGLIAATWAVLSPATFLHAGIRVAGFALAIVTVAWMIRSLDLTERLAAVKPEADDRHSVRSMVSRAYLPVGAIVLLGVIGAALLSRDATVAAADPNACNGHIELCDRRLDEVTIAMTHNSMSSIADDFYLPNQLVDIEDQLDLGTRGLMLDTVYGRTDADGNVLTSGDGPPADTLDAEASVAAEAIRERANEGLSDEAVYFCHSLCEIGSLDAVTELIAIREWMERNPREVLVIIVQDGTEPADTAAMFESAGMVDMLLVQPPGAAFPTLGEMIDRNERIFVLVEEDASGADWLHPAFDLSQETPYSFGSVDEFVCVENRGDPASTMFLVNHFITLARASNRTINDRDVLLDRAEQCAEERGLHPNLLAVDFISQGDVFAVVDELNGVAG